jgi:FkbM family methyltransferase
MATVRDSIDEFIRDIEPFFYGRRLTYVDVGAFKGDVFQRIKASPLRVREAHLIEPNPDTIVVLRETLKNTIAGRNYHIHHLAMGADQRVLRMSKAQDMTKVTSIAEEENTGVGDYFEVPCTTLDQLSRSFTERQISLLKIDVEGFEKEVLRGARDLLEKQQIDVLYVEAGMNPESTQQCYYRDIEDLLLTHGYRLFRIYEQVPEWIQDSPFLRRVNMAYMSPAFAGNNPYRVTKELFQVKLNLAKAQGEAEAGQKRAAELQQSVGDLNGAKAALAQKVRELEKSLADTTQAREDVRRDVEQLQTALGRANEDLQQQNELIQRQQGRIDELGVHLRQGNEQLRERESRLLNLQAKLQEQSTQLTELRGRLQTIQQMDRTEELRGELKRRENQLEASRQTGLASEVMARELLQLVDELRLSERRAQNDAKVALFKEERTRRRLAHRLGTVLLDNIRSPLRWHRVPIEVSRMYKSYLADKAAGALAPLPPSTDSVSFRKGKLAVMPKTHWQGVLIPGSETGNVVWVTVISSRIDDSITIEIETPSSVIRSQLIADQKALESSVRGEIVSLRLFPGRTTKLFGVAGADEEVKIRKARGLSCVLKLELRSADGPVIAALATPALASPRFGEAPNASKSLAATFSRTEKPALASVAETLSPSSENQEQPKVGPAVQAASTSAPKVPFQEPKRMASAILWQAYQLASSGQLDQGIAFATKHARDFVRPAINLLKANRAIGNDQEWLRCVNEYVKQFGIVPLRLIGSNDSLFLRLSAETPPPVTQGPLITVIMPAFNAEATLHFAAKSILQQTWRALELIIVDDFSQDGTARIGRALAQEDSRVRFISNPANVGPYVSKNLALRIATGAFITGHDADDWAHPQRLERHIGEVIRSGGKVRASTTRMVRLNENGYFGHFAKEGKTSDDGALRDAAISCLFEAEFLRRDLGNWDSVRFGADSELIARAERLLSSESGFAKFRQLSMFCLDAEGSLTNDPVHGVSKIHGISPTRRFYREQWTDWHASLESQADAHLDFPQTTRKFLVPEAAAVHPDAIETALRGLSKQTTQ